MFEKIKIKDGKVEIVESSSDKLTITQIKTVGYDPLDSFGEALQNLAKYVAIICEFPEGYESDIEVIGVTLTANTGNGPGAVITALKKLDHASAPLVVNTPHLTVDGEPGLPFGCIEALEHLEGEAEKFIAGKRQTEQLSLVS